MADFTQADATLLVSTFMAFQVNRPDGGKVSVGSALGALQQYVQSDYIVDQQIQTDLANDGK